MSLYLNDTYVFTSTGKIISTGTDEKGQYLVLDQTIFYPQGGGQPSDQGIISADGVDAPISFVKQVENEIRHYCSKIDQNWQGLGVTCKIDQPRRILNARYHTAAHLLANVVEILTPSLKAVKGHQFPGEAYVEFSGTGTIQQDAILDALNHAVKSNLAISTFEILPDEFEAKFYKLPYSVPTNKIFRAMNIGDYSPTPCGGTHVAGTDEIGEVYIRKISAKNNQTKISYELR